MKKILKWLLWILLGSFLGALISEGIGPHALISKITGFLLIFIAAGLFFFSFKLKKKSETKSPMLPNLFRGLGVASLLASLVLFGASISIEEIPRKYDEGMQAFESGQWDKAVKSFSTIQEVNPKYRDTVERLEKAKSNKAKSVYESAKNLLSNARMNLSKRRYSASIDSTQKAISLLKDAKEFNESANLLSEAEEFFGIARKEKQKSEDLQKKEKQQQKVRRPPKLKAWYSGGTLHGAKMSEWSRSPYANRLATSADFVTKLMLVDGMTVPPVNQIRPMAKQFERNISAANKDGIANSLNVSEVAATCWVLMKQ